MGNTGATLRLESEHHYPPPDYEPDADRVTLTFHSGGKVTNGEYNWNGEMGNVYMYDNVLNRDIKLDGLRQFAEYLHGEKDFSIFMSVGNGLRLVNSGKVIIEALNALGAVREIHVYVVDKTEEDAIIEDELDDDEDDLDEVSEFSDSDEPYEYDMRDEETETEVDEENVFDKAGPSRDRWLKLVVENEHVSGSASDDYDDGSDVQVSGDELKSPMGSDEDADDEKSEFPTFNSDDIFNPKFKLGMLFGTKREMKSAIQSYAINEKRSIKFPRNDKRRLVAKCADDSCQWILRGLPVGNESSFRIRELWDEHTCKVSNEVENVSSTWLAKKFKDKFINDPKRSMKAFRLETVKELKVQISDHQVYKARRKALKLIEGPGAEQYQLLWSFAEEINRSNPGSTVIVETDGADGKNRFDRIYVCLHALKEGFIKACRPLICWDGCWLKGPCGGILLTACGVDANNSYMPIAYAVVKKETTETWAWFMENLKHDLRIQDPTKFTLMSDKQKGLIQAEQDIFPGAEYRYCARHLMANFQAAGFKGWSHKKLFWRAAKCTTVNAFERVMDKLHKEDLKAEEWLRGKPPTQWCRAFFNSFPKCDILTNNACETFNGNILEARKKPILAMLQDLHMYLMSRIQRNRDMADKSKRWKEVLCPRIQQILDGYHAKVLNYVATKANANNFQVNSIYDDLEQYSVDLDGGVCGCRKWQVSGIPCIHAYVSINQMKYAVEKYVHKCYDVVNYKKAYALPILPLNTVLEWPKTNHIPIVPPEAVERKVGRPVTERRREQGEGPSKVKKRKAGRPQVLPGGRKMRRQQDSVTCSRCGTRGHNKKKCKAAVITMPSNEEPAVGDGAHKVVHGGGSMPDGDMVECMTQAESQIPQSQRPVQIVVPTYFMDLENQSRVATRPVPSIVKDGRMFMTVSNLLKKAEQDRMKNS